MKANAGEGCHGSCLCGALLNEMELNGGDTFALYTGDSKLQAAPTAALSQQLQGLQKDGAIPFSENGDKSTVRALVPRTQQNDYGLNKPTRQEVS